jgi:drug/metabolite transporter (DMT)-like permease
MNNQGYLLVFLTALISGFSIFIAKFGVGIFRNPYLFTFLRNVTVAIFLSSLLIFFKDWKKFKKLTKKEWLLLILVGLVGGSIPFLLFFRGLSLTSSAEGSFIHKTLFIWTTLLALFFLKEKIDKKFFIGIFILLFANALLLKNFFLGKNYGNLLVLIATLFWAIENTVSKYLLKNLEGREVAWGRMFFGSLFMLVYFLFTNQISELLLLTSKQILWAVLTSILLFGYVITWYSGLKSIPLSHATSILLLGSPITTFLSLVFSGRISQTKIFSAILVIIGVIVILGIEKIFEIIKELKNLIYARA